MSLIHPLTPSTQTVLYTPGGFTPDQIQPNAIDLTVQAVFRIDSDSTVVLSEKMKQHANKTLLEVTYDKNDQEIWYLQRGSYEILFNETIEVGPEEAGWVITRSTLNRNGIFITSGLYDSGYNGVMAGALHVLGPTALILSPGTRVGQYLTVPAEAHRLYSGSYGAQSEHDMKAYALSDGAK